ncbi:MAG: hypothetical protein RLZZ262_377, partial [Bacteroidota bacterium]
MEHMKLQLLGETSEILYIKVDFVVTNGSGVHRIQVIDVW